MFKQSKQLPKAAISWFIEGPGFVIAKGAYNKGVAKAFRCLFLGYNMALERVTYPFIDVAAGNLTVKLFGQDDVKTIKDCLLEKKPYVPNQMITWPFNTNFIKRQSQKQITAAFDTLRESIIK